MHETDAIDLIQPVFDFFVSKRFGTNQNMEEYELSLACFKEFVKDFEPYWVLEKSKRVIRVLLDFDNEIGDCPSTLKEAVLAVVRCIRERLGKEVDKELNISCSLTLRRDIRIPQFISLNSWGRFDWTRPRK